MLTLIPRSAWTDTDFGWKWRGELDPDLVEFAYLHYPGDGVSSYADITEERALEKLRDYRDYHTKSKAEGGRDWSDIGYCYMVDMAGRAYVAGGDYVAAHSAAPEVIGDGWPDVNENTTGMGILLLVGSDDVPSEAMISTTKELILKKREEKFPKLQWILGHGQIPGASTLCPGKHVMAAIDAGKFGPKYHISKEDTAVTLKASVPVKDYYISSPYGPRNGTIHAGTDFRPRAGLGAPVYAVYGFFIEQIVRGRVPKQSASVGEVLAPGRSGNGLRGRCKDNEGVLAGHFSVLDSLKEKDWVDPGQLIGHVDMSGNTSGPHVHQEIWLDYTNHRSTIDVNKRLEYHRSKGELNTNPTGGTAVSYTGNFLPLRLDGDFGHRSTTELQRALKTAGYYKGIIEADQNKEAVWGPMLTDAVQRWLADGGFMTFGSSQFEMYKGIQRFLKSIGVYPYGIDGKAPKGGDTWKGLQAALNARKVGKLTKPTPTPEPTPTPAPEPTPTPTPSPTPSPTPGKVLVGDLTVDEFMEILLDKLAGFRITREN